MKSHWLIQVSLACITMGAAGSFASSQPATLVCENSVTRVVITGATKDGEHGVATLHSVQPVSQGGSGAFDGTYDIVRSSGVSYRHGRRGAPHIHFRSPQDGWDFLLQIIYYGTGRPEKLLAAHDPKASSRYEFVSYGGVRCTPELPSPDDTAAE